MRNLVFMRIYAWAQIALLPPKFLVSEFFMFNREQLVWIAKFHRCLMISALVCLSMVLVTIVRAQNNTQINRIIQELDRQDSRITRNEDSIRAVQVEQAIVNTTLRSMSEKMNAGIGLLGVIATTLLCQFAAAVFKMKWGNALRDTINHEHDRRRKMRIPKEMEHEETL